jgi:hypothetical protein
VRSILTLPLFVLAAAISLPLAATPWQSPALAGLEYVEVQKPVLTIEGGGEETLPSDPETTFGPLSLKLLDLLGNSPVDYPSFVAAYVPKDQVATIEAEADAAGLLFTHGIDSWLQLPFHAFETAAEEDRTSKDFPESFASTPVSGFFLVQFAYPPKQKWLTEMETCGATPLGVFQARTYLFQAADTSVFLGCSPAPFVAWIDSYLTTDRIDPLLLTEESSAGYLLQMRGDVDLSAKASSVGTLAPSIALDELISQDEPPSRFLAVRTSFPDLANLAANDPDLLSIVPRGEAQWSDERQGQIVAGNVLANGQGLTGPGYRPWLECPPWSPPGNCKSVLAGTNHQLIGMIDSGFDDGSQPLTGVNHHPDLESVPLPPPPALPGPDNEERLLEIKNFTNDLKKVPPEPQLPPSGDQAGHGTMVAGILVGQGHPQISDQPFGSGGPTFVGGGKDDQGYFRGSGISPFSRLVVAQVSSNAAALIDTIPAGRHDRALQWMRSSGTTDRAMTINESWNKTQLVSGQVLALAAYDQGAQFYDARVLDADIVRPGLQPTTVVFSAGNQAYVPATNTSRYDSVGSPATAKNVITVGASESYRPLSQAGAPPLDCRDDNPNSPPPPKGRVGLSEDATNAGRVARFSGRGQVFQGKGIAPNKALHQVRIKPDLVAPGVRVFSTVPYNVPQTYPDSPQIGVGCAAYFPPLGSGHYFTYGSGTSFAAPVVTGCAAHLRKWFMDRATNPSPALVKAALIATADNLGGLVGNDHRPSASYGWGRVNLARMLDPRISRFFVDRADRPVSSTLPRVFERTISDTTRDTVVLLSWSDPPAPIVGNSQAALVNNLQLVVEELNAAGGPTGNWRGNNFQENVKGNDTGYSVRFPSAPDLPVTDSINTVEAVFIKANTVPAGRKLRITISAPAVTQGTQTFAVYALNLNPNS